MSRDDDEQLDLASRAFGLFSLAEKRQVLEIFAALRYASFVDRFTESVHRVIMQVRAASHDGQLTG